MNDKKQLENLVESLDKLVITFYDFEECVCGGPLHIVLDDGNMRDDDMKFSREWVAKNEHGYPKHVLTFALGILDILESWSPAQRYLWWNERYSGDLIERMLELHDKTHVDDDE